MSAKLMQMVNSSFFGIQQRIESPAHAAALLGLNVLKPLIISSGIFSKFSTDCINNYSAEALIEHSLTVSHLAKQIALIQTDSKELAEDALLAGLLHDVGQLLLVANLPEEYDNTLALAHDKEVPLYVAENQTIGANHADVGAYLLGLWGLENSIIEAVAFHHEPNKCESNDFTPLTAVHVANVFVNEMQNACDITYSLEFDSEYLERVGVVDQLARWREIVDKFCAVSKN